MATYEFIIRNSGGKSSKSTTPKQESTYGWAGASKETAQNVKKGIAGVGYAEQIIYPMIAHEVNTVALRTGQAEKQQKYQMIFDGVKKGISFGQSVLAGFLVSGGNPIGAVVGATVGLVTTGVQVYSQIDTVNLQRQSENISIALSNQRAGSLGDRYNASNVT